MKNSYFLIIFIFCLSFISSSGLYIREAFVINKTVGNIAYGNFTLINQEPFTFYNISSESNSYISFPQISSLASGQNVTVSYSVFTDQTIGTAIRVRGFYLSNIGPQNKTWNVSVIPYESNPCSFSIIKRDNVNFNNLLTNQLTMRNTLDNNIITIINANTSYNRLFDTSGQFNYYFSIAGFNFPQTCVISVLEDGGYVNNPSLDAFLNLTINNKYTSTTISYSIPINTYTMDFSSTTEGIMTVTNTGSVLAKNVNLYNEWFTFNNNNFDLLPGQSRGIIYTIRPAIFSSNDTGKNYIKTLKISGNFDEINYNFSIFINKAEFNGTASGQDLDYLKNYFCPIYPHSILCEQEPRVVYKYITNGSDQTFNISVTAEQWRNLWLFLFSQGDEIKSTSNLVKDKYEETSSKFYEVSYAISNISNEIINDRLERDESNTGLMVFVGIIGSSFVISLIATLIVIYSRKNKQIRLERL